MNLYEWIIIFYWHLHDRSQTLKSDEAKYPKMTKITPASSFLRGIPMIWTKTDEAIASSASVVATAMTFRPHQNQGRINTMYVLFQQTPCD